MAACQWALDNGVQGLEFDIQVSRDGVPFLFHDYTMNRLTADGDERVIESLEWSTIQAIELKEGGRIPRLEEMLQFAPRVRMNLEIKTLASVPSVLRFLKSTNRQDWLISSFEYDALAAVRVRFPQLELGYLLEKLPDEALHDCLERAAQQITSLGPQRIHLDNGLCTEETIGVLARHNLPIHVWTVNDTERGTYLRKLGVSGIFTDDARVF